MKALAYALNLDCAMYLGDYTTGSATTTIEEGLKHIGIINQDIDEAFKGLPQLRTTGNHDPLTYSYSQNNDYLSEEELFPLIGAYCQGATYGSNTAGYCYRDFASKKIRVICLNTADITAAISELPQHSATLLPYIEMKFNEVEELSDTTRGDGGFGSTGEK